jgi:hypothetical protein
VSATVVLAFDPVSDRGATSAATFDQVEVPADMPLLGGRMALVDRSTTGQDASNEQT